MSSFPTTHATWLATRIEDDFPAARAHILERYFEPLCAYVRSSQLRAFGEPADLVNDFLTHRVTDPAYLARWASSGLPLRRWLANGLLMHTRNAALAARRRRELFANGGASQSERPTGKGAGRPVDPAELTAADLAASASNAQSPHETDALLALERAWAIRTVTEAHERIRTELQAEGRAAWWELFRLHTIHGMSYAQASPIVGIAPTSASSVHRQVVDRLRAALHDIIARDGIGPDDVDRELALMQDLLG
jgi:DNA-directed RNA polymerase specialized sigma24 family protein